MKLEATERHRGKEPRDPDREATERGVPWVLFAAVLNTTMSYSRAFLRGPLRSFHDEEMQRRVWGRPLGVYNDVGTLRNILLHPPGEEILVMTSDKYDPEIDALSRRGAVVLPGRQGTGPREDAG